MGIRSLTFEMAEPRLLLSHSAPSLNANDTAAFGSLTENVAISSNSGETVSTLLATGGPIVDNQPLGSNFMSLDTNDGAQEGIAITGLTGASDGAWEYSTNNGQSWSILGPALTAANAERLAAANELRFLPNQGFTGSVSVSFAAWDLTDGATAGSSVDLTQPNVTDGSTAYSSAIATATLQVVPATSIDPPALVNSIAGTTVAQAGTLAQQNLFTVDPNGLAPNGLVQEDTYFDSTHTDTGWSTIDSNTTFGAGANLTAYSDGTTTNVFGVDQAGQAVWNQYSAAGGWTGFVPLNTLITNATASFTPGTGLTVTTESGVLRLFAVGTSGSIQQYSYSSSSGVWGLRNLSYLPSFPSATPLAIWDTGSIINIFATHTDGSMESINYNFSNNSGSWYNAGNVGLSGTTPLAVTESSNNIDLFGVTSAGIADHIYSSDDSTWSSSNITMGGDIFGGNAALGVQQYASGEFRLFGVNSAGAIKNDYDGGSGWHSQTKGGTPAFSTSAAVAFYFDASSDFQIFAPTASGGLAVEEYNESQNTWTEYALGRSMSPTNLTSSIGGQQIAQAGNLTTQDEFLVGNSFTGGGNTNDGLVRVDTYVYGSRADSGLSVIDPNASMSAGAMLTAYSDGTTTNVFAVGKHGNLNWAQYTPGRGWTGFVQLNSFVASGSATFPAGAPIAAAAESGLLNLFGVGTDGYVREYTYTASTNSWTMTDLSNLPQFAPGAPLAVWDNGSTIDLFGVRTNGATNGAIEWLQESGGTWTASNPTTDSSLAAGTPLAIWEAGGPIDLFGVKSNGYPDQLDYNATTHSWSITSITAGANGYGSTALLSVTQNSSGQFSLFGVNAVDQIKNLHYVNVEWLQESGGSWTASTLPSNITLPSATPLSVVESGGNIYLFAINSSNAIEEITYNNGNKSWTVTNPGSGSITYVNNAALGVQYAGGTFSLYGVNSSGQVEIVSGSGTSWQSKLEGGSPAAFAATSTSPGIALYVDPTGVIEVFGLTASNSLAVVNHSGTAWSDEQLA